MPNVELLKQVLQHIETHPDEWDQREWVTDWPGCKTAYCFAGWTAVLAGARPDEDDEVPRASLPAELANVESCSWPASKGFLHVADAAMYLLGLNEHEADELFEEDNTLDDLRRIVGELVSEPDDTAGSAT